MDWAANRYILVARMVENPGSFRGCDGLRGVALQRAHSGVRRGQPAPYSLFLVIFVDLEYLCGVGIINIMDTNSLKTPVSCLVLHKRCSPVDGGMEMLRVRDISKIESIRDAWSGHS